MFWSAIIMINDKKEPQVILSRNSKVCLHTPVREQEDAGNISLI